MNKHTVCIRRVRVTAIILLMACCGAYARDLTKRLWPTKPLVYCSEASPTGFDPNRYQATPDYTVAATVFNRLLEYERGNINKIRPSLAKRWDISPDGRVYTFYLRRGVKFHTTPWFKPTREFNSEDVVFTFERIRNPDMPFRKTYPAVFPDFSGLAKIISKIEALDPYIVVFTLRTPYAPFLSTILAIPAASILSKEYAQQLLEKGKLSEMSRKPVGTGPFIFRKYDKDSAIYFDGNPEYWKPDDVQLSKLIFSITPDAAVRTQKLIRNECQINAVLRPTDITALKKRPNIQVLSRPGFNLAYLAYNVTHKPLDDVRVRRALDMAINKKAIIDTTFQGSAQIAVAPMSPLQWSYDKSLKDAPRDLKQARQLLAQAGYPNGFTISLWSMPIQRPHSPNSRLMAEMVHADWRKIGVKAEIRTYEWAEYLRRANKGEHDVLMICWTNNSNDPDEWLEAIRFSHWDNKAFNNLLQKARRVADTAERSEFYSQAQKIFKQEQPFTPIAYANIYQAINKNVTGFKINPLGPTIFSGVGLSPPEQAGNK